MKTLSTLFLLLIVFKASATHLLGGYIQARPISGLQYEVTATIFMDGTNEASRQMTEITLCFGDGTTAQATRISSSSITGNASISQHQYRIMHTFPGAGDFRIAASINNRTSTVNLQKVESFPFSVSTLLRLGTFGTNTTPTVSLPTNGFRAGINQRTVFAFPATDPEGDSLIYTLSRPTLGNTSCTNTFPIANSYLYPNAVSRQGTFKLNSKTGELIWDAPTALGIYTFNLLINEFRAGNLISETRYEMVIQVVDQSGAPGIIPPYEVVIEQPLFLGVDGSPEATVFMQLYPNPTQDRFTVHIRTQKPSKPRLQLLTNSGQLIDEFNLDVLRHEHEKTVDIQRLPAGVYFLRAEIDGKTILKKVLRQ